MTLIEFERVADTFSAFHAIFASLFGRRECRERSRDYLQGLLVQAEERRKRVWQGRVGRSAVRRRWGGPRAALGGAPARRLPPGRARAAPLERPRGFAPGGPPQRQAPHQTPGPSHTHPVPSRPPQTAL